MSKISLLTIPFIDEQISSMDESTICRCHPWMEEPYPWMKVSSADDIHELRYFIHGGHPWMKITDDGHGRSLRGLAELCYRQKSLRGSFPRPYFCYLLFSEVLVSFFLFVAGVPHFCVSTDPKQGG